MLSPNATNLVADNCGGLGGAARICTSKLQDAVSCFASWAVQVTNVAPSGNLVPLAGAHDEVTGDWPPTVVGASYVIVTGLPSGDASPWLSAQLIPNDVGADGELHAIDVTRIRTAAERSTQASFPPRPLCPPW
jgi:hypothetical protein